MDPLKPGEIVVLTIHGAVETKRRPALVISSEEYQRQHADVIVGLLTTNLGAARTGADYVLKDWAEAGLDYPSAFRAWISTEPQGAVWSRIGKLTERDWNAVADCLRRTLAVEHR